MGRPLKIKKGPTTDVAYPNYGSLTDPVAPANTWISSNYIGVVGGPDNGSISAVTIANAGNNYSQGATATVSAPELGTGTTATIALTISTVTAGRITAVAITSGGSGYDSDPTITINRPANVAVAQSTMVLNSPIISNLTAPVLANTYLGMTVYGGTNGGKIINIDSANGNITSSQNSTGNATNAVNVVFWDAGTAGSLTTSVAYPTVKTQVYVPGDTQENVGFILRQKGQSKFLVAAANAIQDENIVKNNAYFVVNTGNTNWQALGAPSTVTVGDIFTATANGSGLTSNGVVYLVGQCALANVNNGSLAAGQMTVTITKDAQQGGGTVRLSRLTNKWGLDFQNAPATRWPNGEDNPPNNDKRYLLDFFQASGNIAQKSGADGVTSTNGYGNTVPMAIVNNTNS
jgi:hypothetical protein